MKQLIKKILKEESLKQDLKQSVKNFGWKSTANMIGGTENLVKMAFNGDIMEFLNLYNDLDVVQSKKEPDWTLFRYEKGYNIMVYDRKNGVGYINYNEIWSFLIYGFGLKYNEILDLTERWLSEAYNLRGITTIRTSQITRVMLSETYKL